jgi:hypothetical protein
LFVSHSNVLRETIISSSDGSFYRSLPLFFGISFGRQKPIHCPNPLHPEPIDNLDERFPGVTHCKTVDELFEVVSGKLNEFEDLIDENTMPGLRELFENRKKYLERRKIAMSSLPRLIDMWKQFFTAIHCDKSRSDCF